MSSLHGTLSAGDSSQRRLPSDSSDSSGSDSSDATQGCPRLESILPAASPVMTVLNLVDLSALLPVWGQSTVASDLGLVRRANGAQSADCPPIGSGFQNFLFVPSTVAWTPERQQDVLIDAVHIKPTLCFCLQFSNMGDEDVQLLIALAGDLHPMIYPRWGADASEAQRMEPLAFDQKCPTKVGYPPHHGAGMQISLLYRVRRKL